MSVPGTTAVGSPIAPLPALVVAVRAVAEVARHPTALIFSALMLLVGQLGLRAALERLAGHMVPALLGGEVLSARPVVAAALALAVSGLLGWCGMTASLAVTRSSHGSRSLLDGLSATPALLVCWMLWAVTTTSLLWLLWLVLGTAAGPSTAPWLRAAVVALAVAPLLLAIALVGVSTLLATGWLADRSPPAWMPGDGLRALGFAAVRVLHDPARTTAVTGALLLVTSPLLLLAIFTVPAWIVSPLPAAAALHMVQCLALAAWALCLARGLRLALPS